MTGVQTCALPIYRYGVYFDPARRQAPSTRAEYQACEHVTVVYESGRQLEADRLLADQGITRQIVATVPGLAALAGLLRGSTRVATAPRLLHGPLMHGLALADLPFAGPVLPMFMIWHARHQTDGLHRWLRAAVEAAASFARQRSETGAAGTDDVAGWCRLSESN